MRTSNAARRASASSPLVAATTDCRVVGKARPPVGPLETGMRKGAATLSGRTGPGPATGFAGLDNPGSDRHVVDDVGCAGSPTHQPGGICEEARNRLCDSGARARGWWSGGIVPGLPQGQVGNGRV